MTAARPFANPLRGEVAFTLAGEVYRLRPSFEALARIEAECGGLLALIERAAAGEARLDDIVTVLWACLEAGGAPRDKAAVGRMVAEAGLAQAVPAFRDVLSLALAGPAIDAPA